MQDTQTGRMVRLAEAEIASIEASSPLPSLLEKIPLERQGQVFHEGQHVDLDGSKFVIRKIIKKGLVLHGIPSAK